MLYLWTYEEEDTCCIYGHMRRRIHAVSMDSIIYAQYRA